THPIVDDAYPDDLNPADPYAYRRLYIPAGFQHLDGTRALEYVRSRHGDLIGDFGRSQRQQQLLDAVRSKTNGRGLVANLPTIASELQNSIRTDMTVTELARFAALADQIRGEPVQQYTLLPPKFSNNSTSADGQSIVVPDWREIRPLVDSIFGTHTVASLPMPVPPPVVAAPSLASSRGSAEPVTRVGTSTGLTPVAAGTARAAINESFPRGTPTVEAYGRAVPATDAYGRSVPTAEVRQTTSNETVVEPRGTPTVRSAATVITRAATPTPIPRTVRST
ncbi:MAG: LCP family protein, partial [Chloroflexi bacterium]|nr:LCP family protein [Chloroflexota bacterium]